MNDECMAKIAYSAVLWCILYRGPINERLYWMTRWHEHDATKGSGFDI